MYLSKYPDIHSKQSIREKQTFMKEQLNLFKINKQNAIKNTIREALYNQTT